ncbi:MAG: hypothetical protein HQL46_13060 [Gammaproteobacteria bacterium]|nr:hypothetical protein [Gammaproteobacteria bacterium]
MSDLEINQLTLSKLYLLGLSDKVRNQLWSLIHEDNLNEKDVLLCFVLNIINGNSGFIQSLKFKLTNKLNQSNLSESQQKQIKQLTDKSYWN